MVRSPMDRRTALLSLLIGSLACGGGIEHTEVDPVATPEPEPERDVALVVALTRSLTPTAFFQRLRETDWPTEMGEECVLVLGSALVDGDIEGTPVSLRDDTSRLDGVATCEDALGTLRERGVDGGAIMAWQRGELRVAHMSDASASASIAELRAQPPTRRRGMVLLDPSASEESVAIVADLAAAAQVFDYVLVVF